MSGARGRFRFGPRDQRGMLASLRPSQVVSLAIGGAVACGVIAAVPRPWGIMACVVSAAASCGIALGRAGSRPIAEWVPIACAFARDAARGRHRFVFSSGVPAPRAAAPAVFRDVEFASVGDAGGVGIAVDRGARTMSCAISVETEGFSLFDEDDRDRAVATWSAVLDAVSTLLPLARVKWIVQTTPDPLERLRPVPVAPSTGGADGAHAYAALRAAVGATAMRTDQLLVVSTAVGRRDLAAGQAAGAFARQCASVADGIRATMAAEATLMSARALAGATRRRFNRGVPEIVRRVPWPDAIEEHWDCVRTDGLWHATYWIAEWPRAGVPAGFLMPVLGAVGVRRTIVVAMGPVGSNRAAARAERRRTSSAADVDLRRRYGFAVSSRVRSQHEAIVQREEEVAQGHAIFEFSGYVTVSADSPEGLRAASARIEHACAVSRLEIRRLYGMQLEALWYGLATSRGVG